MDPADPAHAREVETDSHRLLVATFSALKARHLIDLGCGSGETAAQLADAGFDVLGIDPSQEAIATARRQNRPDLRFEIGAAEDLAEDLRRFDGAVFLNALHHVAPERMADAVLAALGLLVPHGRLLVIEPLAEGSFFEAMRAVEDETDIRAAAARTIRSLVGQGRVRLFDLLRWNRVTHCADLTAFLDRLVAVDPARAALVEANRAQIAANWEKFAKRDKNGFVLTQPIVCWQLAPVV
jgi:SAM-dependent methyltransferase